MRCGASSCRAAVDVVRLSDTTAHAHAHGHAHRYRSRFEHEKQRPSGISAFLLRPYWSVTWRTSLYWIAFTLVAMVVVLVFLVHQYDSVTAVDTTFECSMLHPSTPSTPGGCVLAFRCTVPQDPLTALRALATLAVFATALSRNLLYARLWWGRLPPPRHDLFGWWFNPESSERAKMAQSVRQLRRDEARINFPPILHNDALVQLPHVWGAYFNLFVDPNNRMSHAIKSAVQVRPAAPSPLVSRATLHLRIPGLRLHGHAAGRVSQTHQTRTGGCDRRWRRCLCYQTQTSW